MAEPEMDYSALEIRGDVPFPERSGQRGRRTGLSGVLRRLEVGQSIAVPLPNVDVIGARDRAVWRVKNLAYQLARRIPGADFYVKREGDAIRVWRGTRPMDRA